MHVDDEGVTCICEVISVTNRKGDEEFRVGNDDFRCGSYKAVGVLSEVIHDDQLVFAGGGESVGDLDHKLIAHINVECFGESDAVVEGHARCRAARNGIVAGVGLLPQQKEAFEIGVSGERGPPNS